MIYPLLIQQQKISFLQYLFTAIGIGVCVWGGGGGVQKN